MVNNKPFDKEEFKKKVVDNCKMLYRRSIKEADKQQVFQSVAYAADAGAVGGMAAEELMPRTGGRMTGVLEAENDTTGAPAVRNIRYGTVLPEVPAEGEIFILLAEEA